MTNHKHFNFGRHHAGIPKKLSVDGHSHHNLPEPLHFSALLAFLSWEMSKVGNVVGKESHDCTEDSFIDILMFSCLQMAAYFSTYVC